MPCSNDPAGSSKNSMKSLVGLLIVGMMASSVSAGRVPAPARQEKESVISIDVDWVDVYFAVTDKKGKSIRNLKQEHFRVYENDRLQNIKSFNAEGNLPLTVALLVDTSGSIGDRLRFEQQAAVKFFHSTVVRRKDRAVVLSFDSNLHLIQDYTDDTQILAQAVQKMRAGGSTALYDAIRLAASRKLAGQDGRRIMVIISDGEDTFSRTGMQEALDAAQRNDVIVYAISTNSSGLGGDRNKKGDDVLRKFAEVTGGRVFFPSKIDELSSSFANITEELRFQYALSYIPTDLRRDGAFRRIRIESVDKRYMVRSRSGYFAPEPAGLRSR
jgi:VWFA-related protein